MEEQQHAIPQQISSYQFRLVGDMTLKQFFQVAGGVVVAIIIYSSGLPGYIKLPLILISFLAGIALAFFPIQDRPLEKWIILFIKSIYSPTLYVWNQQGGRGDYFKKEEIALPQSQQTTTTPPHPKTVTAPQQPTATSEPAAKPIPELEKGEEEFLSKVDQTLQGKAPIQTQPQKPSREQKDIRVPTAQKVEVEREKEKEIPKTETPKTDQTEPDTPRITAMAGKHSDKAARQAQFSQEAGPPSPPNKPNVVVGQVLDPSGKIVENAILEIKDSQERPVRALKSNKLGHFMIVTPLSDGEYEIVTEKDGLNFDPVKFKAGGDIIPPIAIWSTDNQEQDQQTDQNQLQTQQEKTIYNQGN